MIDTKVSRRAVVAGMAALPFLPTIARAGEKVGGITRFDPALDAIIDANAPIEVLGTGYKWAEGPAWNYSEEYLLFTDVPSNVCYRWQEGEGVTVFLSPSGLAGPIPAGIREAGANGLHFGSGALIMADSGSRAIAEVDLETKAKKILADRFEGKRFNSCNDLDIAGSGAIYFTDPPYGLAEGDSSPLKELPFNGVFRLSPDGKVTVIDRTLTRPNGIALSPDERTLYVAISDPERPEILAYALGRDGLVRGKPRLFHDARPQLAKKMPGLPDGLKVDRKGNVYATGPGGVHILSPGGKLLGIVATGKAIANCCFGGDGSTLFLTSSNMLARVRLKVPAVELLGPPVAVPI